MLPLNMLYWRYMARKFHNRDKPMDARTRRRLNFISVMSERGYKYSDLRNDFGLDGNYLNRLANNADKGMGDVIARRIEKAFNLSPNHLDRAIDHIDSGRAVAYIARLESSDVMDYLHDESRSISGEMVMPVQHDLGGCFCVQHTGDAMQPKIVDGDELIIRPGVDAKIGQVVLAKLADAPEPIVRRYSKDAGKIYLVADERAYGVKELKTGDEILGVAVRVVREVM